MPSLPVHPDWTVVIGSKSRCPILLMPGGYTYLRTWEDRRAGRIATSGNMRMNQLYPLDELTDEECALLAQLRLTHA